MISVDEVEILQMLDELTQPCVFADEQGCQQTAKWIMHSACPLCPKRKLLLACDFCKALRMTSEDGVICIDLAGNGCGEVIAPARHMYSRVEAL